MIVVLFMVFAWISATSAYANLYMRPRAGATIPVDGGDPSYSLGLTAGYQWTNFLATELSYSRLFATGNGADGDMIRGEGILSFPMPVATPYASGGFGALHTEIGGNDDWTSMILLGAGVTFQKILFLSFGAGVSYAIVQDGQDFLEPYVSIGIVF